MTVLCLFCLALTTAAATSLNDGLAAYWSFDEEKGDTAYDKSGNGNNGVISGATRTAGPCGGALAFAGNGRVDCGHGPSLNVTGAITVAAWITLSEYPVPKISWGWRDIINKPGAYQLSVVKGQGLTFQGLNGGKIVRQHEVDSEFVLNKWYHVAVTYNTQYNERKIYVNGVEHAVGNRGRVFGIDTTASNLRIGSQDGGEKYGLSNQWRGSIDEVRIYRRVLAPAEIMQLYRLCNR
jgi:hypothetical protein